MRLCIEERMSIEVEWKKVEFVGAVVGGSATCVALGKPKSAPPKF